MRNRRVSQLSQALHTKLAGYLVRQAIADVSCDPRDRAESPKEEVHEDLRHEEQHEDHQPQQAGPDANARPRA